jgi:hypothetical protein
MEAAGGASPYRRYVPYANAASPARHSDRQQLARQPCCRMKEPSHNETAEAHLVKSSSLKYAVR